MRTETDSLGKVSLPDHALWGAQTQRALENYQISDRTAHPELIRAYLRVKRAAATVNSRLGVLSRPNAALIQKAIDGLLKREREWSGIFPVDPYQAGAGTSQNMNINEVVANLANRTAGGKLGEYKPVHPNDHVNRSQSTNDSFPTTMRLALLDASRPLALELKRLSASLAKKGRAWSRLTKSARTHLQDAVPITLGQEFAAYAGTVDKCLRWLESGRDELRVLGIGGSAAGTGLTVPKGYAGGMVRELARLSGERLSLAPNLCEAMQSQAAVAHYAAMLKLVALELTRVCNDLRLMASGPMTGLAEIYLPAVQPGSSIMPGKVNPSILEMCNQSFYSVIGYEQTIAYCTQAGQLELNVMMPMMAYSGLEATRVATRTIATLRLRCVDGLEANTARLKKYFESTPQVATALSPKLGYDQTAKLVKEALAQGKSVIELIRERKLMPEKDLARALDWRALTGHR